MKWFTYIAVVAILGLWVFLNVQDANPRQAGQPHAQGAPDSASAQAAPVVARPSDLDICAMAHVFIKRQLKSPSSAVFPACSTADTTISGSGSNWTVKSYVDAQNSFGADLRADYTVAMRYQASTDKWTMDSFTLDNR